MKGVGIASHHTPPAFDSEADGPSQKYLLGRLAFQFQQACKLICQLFPLAGISFVRQKPYKLADPNLVNEHL